MKKPLLFCCLFSLLFPTMQAQEFAPIGAKWTYSWLTSLISPNKDKDEGYSTIESVEEVLVQGKNCKRLVRQIYSPNGIVYDSEDLIIYQEGDTIFRVAEDGVFDILYIFNASAGDTWETREYDNRLQTYRPVTISVISTSSTVINGITYRELSVCTINDSFFSFGCYEDNWNAGGTPPVKITERFGASSYMLLQNFGSDGPINIALRCYEDGQVGNYSTGVREDCLFIEGNPTCFCTSEYEPVCGDNGRTYGSRCLAACAGVQVVATGMCPRNTTPVPCQLSVHNDYCSNDPLVKEIIHYQYQGTNYKVYFPNIDRERSFNLSMEIYNCDKQNSEYYDGEFMGNTSITSIDDFFRDAEVVEILFDVKDCPPIPQIALDYPIIELVGIFDFKNCTSESIEVYQQGVYLYYLVTDTEGNVTLYNGRKGIQCQSPINVDYDCVAAYQLGSPLASFNCGAENTTENNTNPSGSTSDQVFEDFPWLSTTISTTCTDGSVSVYQSGAYNFLFVQSAGIEQLYFEDGTYYCENTANYDCVSAYNLGNPISTWTCNATTSPPTNTDNSLYDKYPFLQRALDPNNCQGKSIEVYDQGSYAYLFIRTSSNEGTLYLDNGDFYCTSTPTYNCLSAYGLSNPSTIWNCDNSVREENTERSKSRLVAKAFKVYPNPTVGKLVVELPPSSQTSQQLQVIDRLGRVIQQQDIPSSLTITSVVLDLSKETSGLYYVAWYANGQSMVQKVLKQD